MNNKLDMFFEEIKNQIEVNSHKGDFDTYLDHKDIISEIEYHKAKALMAIKEGHRKAAKEYLADTAALIFALGNTIDSWVIPKLTVEHNIETKITSQ